MAEPEDKSGTNDSGAVATEAPPPVPTAAVTEGDAVIDEAIKGAAKEEEAIEKALEAGADEEEVHHQAEEVAEKLVKGMDRQQLGKMLSEAFDSVDTDGNGVLDREEFARCFEGLDMDKEQVDKIMAGVDIDNDGSIAYKEFLPLAYEMLVQDVAEKIIHDVEDHVHQHQEEAGNNKEQGGAVQSVAGSIDTMEQVVQITVQPQGFQHTETFQAGDTVSHVKMVLGERFKMAPEHIHLATEERELLAEDVIRRYGKGDPSVPLQLIMQIRYSEPNAPASTYQMPDIIEVNLGPPNGDETAPDQIVLVKVVRENLHREKPFLGGFRHKLNNRTYHHGSSQTVRKRRVKGVDKVHRQAQTVSTATRSQQTCRETGTHMDRPDMYNDHSKDKTILARKYFTTEELQQLRDQKAKEIQCFLRQCFAWRRVRRLREARYETEFQEVQAKDDQAQRTQDEHRRQIERRMHPRTKDDFDVLHRELEAWRLHETQRIKNSGLPKDEIHFELEELLGKEVKLLQTIDRLKITAARENKQTRTKETLEKMASPKEWASSEGDLVEVETPFTTRAKELVELYNGLCLSDLPKLQRVDVLLHVKYTVKEFDCDLTRDIVELIEREEDLIRRGRSEKSLEALRRRLSNLFLQFIDTPEFNPEAANFQRVPGV